MKEPSENDIKKEKQSELDKIADMNAKCVAGYSTIRNTIFNGIEDADLVRMNKYVSAEYGKVYTGLKGMIIDALNDAKDKNVKLVEKLLDTNLPAPKHYEVLPQTSAFKFTNRVFTEKSISVRSQNAADMITKIIADGRNEGLAIKDIQKKIDTVMGFRDAQGNLTDKSKKLIESGKFSHRNGSIYETYRIARTETMRMNAYAKYDQFLELKKDYPNVRLKIKATLDGREREQSKEMNGQVSNADGEFLYPDGKFYRLGEAPAQWCINDREVQYIVFLNDKEITQSDEELQEQKQELEQENQEQKEEKQEVNRVENLLYPDEIAGVKRGEPMSIEKANEGHVNPKYDLGGGYRINCQSCVVNYELRLRGYDTETLPNTKGSTLEKLSRKTNLAWLDVETGKNPDYLYSVGVKNATSCYKWLNEIIEDGKRYTIEFEWAGRGHSGHIVSISKTSNGLMIYDPQTSKKYFGETLISYFKRIKYKRTISYVGTIPTPPKVLRVDNAGINKEIVDNIVKKSD